MFPQQWREGFRGDSKVGFTVDSKEDSKGVSRVLSFEVRELATKVVKSKDKR